MPPFVKGGTEHQRKPRKKPNPLPPAVLGGLVKTGRPETYQDTYPAVVERLRLLMMTDGEIAKFFGVAPTTLHLWAKKHPAFNEAYARGGEEADAEIVLALRHRAKGYSHPEEKIFLGANNQVIREETTRHYPPSEAAMGLWLSNRQRARWKLKFDPDKDEAGAVEIRVTGGLPDE